MLDINPAVMEHRPNVDPAHKPLSGPRWQPQRYRSSWRHSLSRSANILVDFKCGSPVGTWRLCVDFTDLNVACPKDSYPLPKTDNPLDATAGHALLSFMDAFSGYHQIPEYFEDQTAFVTDRGLHGRGRLGQSLLGFITSR